LVVHNTLLEIAEGRHPFCVELASVERPVVIKVGVIDLTKVTRCALQNAVYAAGLLGLPVVKRRGRVLCTVVEPSGNESGSDKEAMQVRRPMLRVFKPKALATLTDEGGNSGNAGSAGQRIHGHNSGS
jgi:hypothetical protein